MLVVKANRNVKSKKLQIDETQNKGLYYGIGHTLENYRNVFSTWNENSDKAVQKKNIATLLDYLPRSGHLGSVQI